MKAGAYMTEAVIRRIVRGEDPVYSTVYFYGEPEHVAAALEKLEEDYRAANPEKRLVLVDGEEYVEGLYRAVGTDRLARYMYPLEREYDLFVLRGIEEIGRGEFPMETIYGILDHCLEYHVQLVVTGSVPVKDLICLEDRLRAQLSGGLCCRVDMTVGKEIK